MTHLPHPCYRGNFLHHHHHLPVSRVLFTFFSSGIRAGVFRVYCERYCFSLFACSWITQPAVVHRQRFLSPDSDRFRLIGLRHTQQSIFLADSFMVIPSRRITSKRHAIPSRSGRAMIAGHPLHSRASAHSGRARAARVLMSCTAR